MQRGGRSLVKKGHEGENGSMQGAGNTSGGENDWLSEATICVGLVLCSISNTRCGGGTRKKKKP
jgi:hypothetical protein